MSTVVKKAFLAIVTAMTSAAASAVDVVDLLVAYDRSAVAWLAEEDGRSPQTFAEDAVAKLNAVLPATELDKSFTFNLAGVFLSAAETTGVSPYDRLYDAITSVCDGTTGKAIGAWTDIQAARETVKADIVLVLVDAGGSGTAGLSWQLGQGGNGADVPSFARMAYSACNIAFVDRAYLLPHEIGHVMGAGHSERLVDDPGPQLNAYSSAYHFEDEDGNRYATIMGYFYLSADDRGYEVIPCYSSATHFWNGMRLGDAMHDNTRTLRETCGAVSRFRISGNEGDDPIPEPAIFASKTVVDGAVRSADGSLTGLVRITVAKTDKKGFSKVSGYYIGLDGKKRTIKAVKTEPVLEHGLAVVSRSDLIVKGHSAALSISVCENGDITGRFGDAMIEKTDRIGRLSSIRPAFSSSGLVDGLSSLGLISDVRFNDVDWHLIPDGEGVSFDASVAKWKFPKAGKVKYVVDRRTKAAVLTVNTGKDGLSTNLSGLKLSVSQKTGLFKGTFSVYLRAGTPAKPKVKSVKMKVTGLVADGEGTGVVVCSKLGWSGTCVVR